MVVPKRKVREVTVEIKDHITIDINEEVTSALLRVNEAAHLVGLIQVVGLSALKSFLLLRARVSRLNVRLGELIRILEPQEV